MEEGRILKFTLTKSEVSELALRLSMDCILMTKAIWLGLALLAFLPSMLIPSRDLTMGTVIRILLGNISICGAIILTYAAMRYISFCRFCRKNGFLKERVYRLDHGSLTYLEDNSSMHCSHFTSVTETGRLLLLKRPISKGSFQFYVFPKRIFDGREDIQEFLAYFRNPQPACREPADGPPQQAEAGTAYDDSWMNLLFSLNDDEFAHVYTQVVRIVRNQNPSVINARTLLFLVIPLAFLGSTVFEMMMSGDIITGILFMGAGIMGLIYLMLKTTEIREETYRKLIRGKRLPVNESGKWDMVFTCQNIYLKHDQDSFERKWDVYTHLYETIDNYFLVRINGKRVEQYVFVPKWALMDQEQKDHFLGICGANGLHKQYVYIPEAEDPEGTSARLRRRNILMVSFTLLLFGLSIAAVILKPILMVIFRYALKM